MRSIITVIGRDKVGIISTLSAMLAKNNVNILDISQTILQDLFTMIMIVDIKNCTKSFEELTEELDEVSKAIGLEIRISHEDLFNKMHRI